MKAVAYKKPLQISQPEVFSDITLEQPIASGHDLLVEVKA